jgi:hypothetical protein
VRHTSWETIGRRLPISPCQSNQIEASWGLARRSTLICCRSTRISASSATCDRNRSLAIPKINRHRSSIGYQHRAILAQLPARLNLGQGQDVWSDLLARKWAEDRGIAVDPYRHHHSRPHHHQVVQAAEQDSFPWRLPKRVSAGLRGWQQLRRARPPVRRRDSLSGWRSPYPLVLSLPAQVIGAGDVDDRALSWERHQHIAPQVGAVVTMVRRGGGHFGIVSGFTKNGDPIVISGNHGNRVPKSVYRRHGIRAWVSPT